MGGSGVGVGAAVAIVDFAFDFVLFFVCELMFIAVTAPIQTTAIQSKLSRLPITPSLTSTHLAMLVQKDVLFQTKQRNFCFANLTAARN
jgi:hypothetical protein